MIWVVLPDPVSATTITTWGQWGSATCGTFCMKVLSFAWLVATLQSYKMDSKYLLESRNSVKNLAQVSNTSFTDRRRIDRPKLFCVLFGITTTEFIRSLRNLWKEGKSQYKHANGYPAGRFSAIAFRRPSRSHTLTGLKCPF